MLGVGLGYPTKLKGEPLARVGAARHSRVGGEGGGLGLRLG